MNPESENSYLVWENFCKAKTFWFKTIHKTYIIILIPNEDTFFTKWKTESKSNAEKFLILDAPSCC